MGDFPSGQRGQTVNLLLFSFGGPNPPSPTKKRASHSRCSFLALGVVLMRNTRELRLLSSPSRLKFRAILKTSVAKLWSRIHHLPPRKEHRIRGALFLRWDGVDEDHSRIALAVFPILFEVQSNSQDERSEVVVTNPPSPTKKRASQRGTCDKAGTSTIFAYSEVYLFTEATYIDEIYVYFRKYILTFLSFCDILLSERR